MTGLLSRSAMRVVGQVLYQLIGFVCGLLVATALYNMNTESHVQFDIPKQSADGCVCSPPAQLSSLNPVTLVDVHTAPPDDIVARQHYLHPPQHKPILSKRDMRKRGFKPKAEQKLLSQEYPLKQQLFVGVLTQQDYLPTRAKALYDTWGQKVNKLVFFVGQDCNVSSDLSYLPIVKLEGIPDRVYPPLLKAFAALKHMYTHHINEFNWFVRADDDMYVRTEKLSELLLKMDPNEHVYMGLAGAGRIEDLRRLQLLAHERYCMGGPGVFMSSLTLGSVGPHLDNCLNAVLFHDLHTRSDWNDDDVEIGRCVSRKLGVQCSTSQQSHTYFHFDYEGVTLDPVTYWTDPKVHDLITLHPIKDPNNMYAIHHFYKTLEFQKLYKELEKMANDLNALCSNLLSYVAPPSSVGQSCDLKLHPHLAYFNDTSHHSHLGNAPGMYVRKLQRVSFIHRSKDKFDLLPWIRFNDTHIQESTAVINHRPLSFKLKTELANILNNLGDHLQDDSKVVKLIDGYVRFNPHLGREYMLTVLTSDLSHKSYRMFRELSPVLSVIKNTVHVSRPTVHILLPLEQVGEKFKDFFQSYVTFGLNIDNGLHLIVVVTSVTDQLSVSDLIGRNFNEAYTAHVTVIISEGTFNRLRLIDDAMSSLHGNNSLVFLADVSIRFRQGFFSRCRTNTQIQKSVYFPIAFSAYDNLELNSWNGEWNNYKFISVCVYKIDYDRVRGYTNAKYTVELFERFSKSFVEVVQAPDPGLFRVWSERRCEGCEA